LFVFSAPAASRARHSFPTRRSSDLGLVFKKWSHLQEACGDPLPYFSSGVRDPYTSSWSVPVIGSEDQFVGALTIAGPTERLLKADRKSTRLNSSHVKISYAVFCLKK